MRRWLAMAAVWAALGGGLAAQEGDEGAAERGADAVLVPGTGGEAGGGGDDALPGADDAGAVDPAGAAADDGGAQDSAETDGQADADPDAAGADAAPHQYVIRQIDFDSQGRTRAFALVYHGEFKAGERLSGQAALERYIARKTQSLLNQRVLDAASIEYTLGEPESDGAVPVTLLVHTRDTWNIIALPYPKYDSNEGFSLTLKARDYNFFGTMVPLRIDLGWKNEASSESEGKGGNTFTFAIDSDIPFRALGLDWNIDFDHDFEYTDSDDDARLAYQNTTGVSVELPVEGGSTVTLGFNEYVYVNEENSAENQEAYNLGPYYDGVYAASELYAAYRIPVGVEVGPFGPLAYTPRVSGRVAYAPGLDESRRGVTAALSHSLGFGQVDWIGNYRRGLEASLSNTNSVNVETAAWNLSVTAVAAAYYNVARFFGASARLRFTGRMDNGLNYGAGDTLRGVLDDDVRASSMLSLNLDLPFRVLRFAPSEWFHTSRLRLFDFEMQVSPFLDAALYNGRYSASEFDDGNGTPVSFDFADGLYAGGVEIIVFPAFMRSLYIRASLGYKLDAEFPRDGKFPKWDELFFGIGHHY